MSMTIFCGALVYFEVKMEEGALLFPNEVQSDLVYGAVSMVSGGAGATRIALCFIVPQVKRKDCGLFSLVTLQRGAGVQGDCMWDNRIGF